MAGFIVIDRKMRDWRWYHNGTARSIWLYLLLEANWKDGYLSNGQVIQRGSLARSLRTMADESGLSVNTVRYWLKKFTESGEITVSTTQGYTVISIVKYDDFQNVKVYHNTLTDTGTDTDCAYFDTPTDTVTDTLTDTDRTHKTQKTQKSKDSSSRMKRPTLDDVQQYISENHYAVNASEFMDYYESNGWKVGRNPMKDWKATVRKWHSNEQKRLNERNKKGELPF